MYCIAPVGVGDPGSGIRCSRPFSISRQRSPAFSRSDRRGSQVTNRRSGQSLLRIHRSPMSGRQGHGGRQHRRCGNVHRTAEWPLRREQASSYTQIANIRSSPSGDLWAGVGAMTGMGHNRKQLISKWASAERRQWPSGQWPAGGWVRHPKRMLAYLAQRCIIELGHVGCESIGLTQKR